MSQVVIMHLYPSLFLHPFSRRPGWGSAWMSGLSVEDGGSSHLPEEEDFYGQCFPRGLWVGGSLGERSNKTACGVKPVYPHCLCGFDCFLTSLPQFPHLEHGNDSKTHLIDVFEDEFRQ